MKTKTLLNQSFAWANQRVRDWHPHITRTRVAVFAVTLVAIGLSLGGIDSTPPEAVAYSRSMDLELPSLTAVEIPEASLEQALSAPLPELEEQWENVTVKSGQTLDRIFRDQGFSVSLMHDILTINDDTKGLTRIRPGDVFNFQRHEDGSLSRLRFPINESAWLIVDATEAGVMAERLDRQVYSEVRESEGVIESSLFLAGKRAGLSDNLVMQLANIFGWDIDFILDIRSGDHFYVVYEKIYRDGEFLRDGEILAATFINQGERFQAIRYEMDGAGRYFSPDGRPMRKAFLRAPLNFSYISSNFNPKRFHPILKRVKPHRGIDYRAPTGTPVYAAGSGRVTTSAYDKYNGHHVFIQHAGSIVTKYLHFTNRTVKKGQSVRQGQVIGYVGSTGMSTAPHLHYEFVVNGVHRNPRTVPLPKVEPLEGELLTAFQTHAAPLQNHLARLEAASMYAAQE